MSKAFVNENNVSAPADDAGGEESEAALLPRGFKNYITPAGARRLRDELKRLLDVDRPEVVRTVSWAASNGDRSENGDYIYGKKRLREIDRRIRFLQRRLDIAEVVDPALQKGSKVLFGATVVVEDEEGVRKTYRIVGIDEADASQGCVSWISPLAKALLNHSEGETVVLRTPRGEEDLEILSVKFEG
jgi:transcription elongation factor GreB